MTNKYRQGEPLQPGTDTARPMLKPLNLGYRGDVDPGEIPVGGSPELNDVRFERGAIRKDFGWTPVGTAASSVILGILEHKYIDGGETFQRLIRVYQDGSGKAALEVWSGTAWVLTDTSTEDLNPVYLSMLSAIQCAYMADGTQVLEWCEVLEKIDQENDFPSGNELDAVGESTIATVTPGSPEQLSYQIAYDVTVHSSDGQNTRLLIGFFHEAVKVGEREYNVGQFESMPVVFDSELFSFDRVIADMDEVSIEVLEAEGGGVTTEIDNVLTPSGGAPDVEGDKTPPEQPAIGNKYRYAFSLSGGDNPSTVTFYYDNGAGFVAAAAQDFNDGAGHFLDVIIPDLVDPNALFGMGVDVGNLGDTQVVWDRSNADFTIHGHNKGTQADDPAGVFYQTLGNVVSEFTKIDPGPGGRFLLFFARRLVVFRNMGDTQAMTWSADGILNDFVSVGSGEIILVEARSDATDDLMGGAVLSSNFAALFRRRSIWRVFETGINTPALGAVSWIENLGTSSPFSVRNVRGGVIFLGHDMMVYFLTEAGPTAIGLPIHQDLVEELISNLELVDAGYDPLFGEYYLGIPRAGSTIIDRVWIFDVDRYVDRQEIIWRRRDMEVQRFGETSTIDGITDPTPITVENFLTLDGGSGANVASLSVDPDGDNIAIQDQESAGTGGIAVMNAAGTRVWSAQSNGVNLRAINTSDPANPVDLYNYDMSADSQVVGGSGGSNQGLWYSDVTERLYVMFRQSNAGTTDSEVNFFIYDVSDDGGPVLLGQLLLPAARQFGSGLVVSADELNAWYVLDRFAGNLEVHLQAVAISSDGTTIQTLGNVQLLGSGGFNINASCDYIDDNTLVVLLLEGPDAADNFFTIDVSTPGSPAILDSLEFTLNTRTSLTAKPSIDRCYVMEPSNNTSVHIVDISDPSNLSVIDTITDIGVSGASIAQLAALESDDVVVTIAGVRARTWDVSDPDTMTMIDGVTVSADQFLATPAGPHKRREIPV